LTFVGLTVELGPSPKPPDSHGLTLRLEQAGFEETATFEQIVWDSPVSFDRARVREPLVPSAW